MLTPRGVEICNNLCEIAEIIIQEELFMRQLSFVQHAERKEWKVISNEGFLWVHEEGEKTGKHKPGKYLDFAFSDCWQTASSFDSSS